MIAAVTPTSASSRNGTPAPRSESASSPPATFCTSLTTGCTVLDNVESDGQSTLGRGSSGRGQGVDIDTEHLGDGLGGHGTLSEYPRAVAGEVDDRRCGLLL